MFLVKTPEFRTRTVKNGICAFRSETLHESRSHWDQCILKVSKPFACSFAENTNGVDSSANYWLNLFVTLISAKGWPTGLKFSGCISLSETFIPAKFQVESWRSSFSVSACGAKVFAQGTDGSLWSTEYWQELIDIVLSIWNLVDLIVGSAWNMFNRLPIQA